MNAKLFFSEDERLNSLMAQEWGVEYTIAKMTENNAWEK